MKKIFIYCLVLFCLISCERKNEPNDRLKKHILTKIESSKSFLYKRTNYENYVGKRTTLYKFQLDSIEKSVIDNHRNEPINTLHFLDSLDQHFYHRFADIQPHPYFVRKGKDVDLHVIIEANSATYLPFILNNHLKLNLDSIFAKIIKNLEVNLHILFFFNF